MFDEDENSLIKIQNDDSLLDSNVQKVSPIKKNYSPKKIRDTSLAFEIPKELDQPSNFIGNKFDGRNRQGSQMYSEIQNNYSMQRISGNQSNLSSQGVIRGFQDGQEHLYGTAHYANSYNPNINQNGIVYGNSYPNQINGGSQNDPSRGNFNATIFQNQPTEQNVQEHIRGPDTPERPLIPHRKRPTPSGNKYHFAGGNISTTGTRTGKNDVSFGKQEESRVGNTSNSFLVAAPPSRLRQTISQLRFDLEKCQRQLDFEKNERSELKIHILERNEEVTLLRRQLDDFRDLSHLYNAKNLESIRGSILSKSKEDYFNLQQEYNKTLERVSSLTDELAHVKNELAAKESQLSRVLMENREADSLLSTRSSRIQKLEQEVSELKSQIERISSNELQSNQRSSIEVDELKTKIQGLNNQLDIEKTNAKKFEKRFEDTKTDIRILKEQVNKFQDEIVTKDTHIETLKQEIQDIKLLRDRNIEDTYYQQIEELKGRYQSKINSIHGDHEKKIQNIKSEYEQTIQTLRKDYDSRFDDLKSINTELQQSLDQLRREHRNLLNKPTISESIQTIEQMYTEEDLINHAKKYAKPLEEEILHLEESKNLLTEQNEKLEDQIKEIEYKVDSIKAHSENAHSKQTENERKIQHLNNHIQNVEESYKRRSEQVKELEQELEDLSKQLQQKKIESVEQISKLESEIKLLNQRINVNDMELKEKDRTITQLERSLRQSQLENEDTEQIRIQFSNQIKLRDEEVDSMKRLLNDRTTRMKQEYDRQIEDLKKQISQSSAEISTRKHSYDTEMRDMRNENEIKQAKIIEQESKIQKLKEYISQLQEHYRDIKSKLSKSLNLANIELQRQKEILRTKDEQISSLEKQHQILHSQALRSSSLGRSSFKIDP